MTGRRRLGAGHATTLLLLAWTAFLVWRSWMTWADPQVDFGRELYVPWRLAAGDVLYRDVFYVSGPLSPYVNALLFRVFGTHLAVLLVANALVLTGVVVLVGHLLRRLADPVTALVAQLVLLGLFAFNTYGGIANFDFLCPYSHEMTHGLLLSLAALASAERSRRGAPPRQALATGLLLGLVFLTKPDVAVASALGVLPLLVGRPAAELVRVALAAALPFVAATALLALALPFGEALAGALGSWPEALRPELRKDPFYLALAGLDDVGGNATTLAVLALLWALTLTPGLAAGSARGWNERRGLLLAVAAAGFGALHLVSDAVDWIGFGRPLPVVAGAAAVFAVVARRRLRAPRLALGLSLLAAGYLAKVILAARLVHYGFVLAVPATLVCVLLLTSWIPAELDRRSRSGAAFRAWALGLLAAVVVAHLELSAYRHAFRKNPFGLGSEVLRADSRAVPLQAALEYLDATLEDGETLAVLPEGAQLNYFLRTRSSLPWNNFVPTALAWYGCEAAVLPVLRAEPPDCIVLVHRDTTEYGPRFFTRDYALEIGAWIEAEYESERTFGAVPFESDRFGVRVLRRR